MTTITQKLAAFVADTTYDSLPPEATDVARRTLLDTAGVALAGRRESAADIACRYAQSLQCAGRASVLAGGFQTSAEEAAFANGVLSHVLDYDDVGHRAQGHLSAVLYPAILAVAEEVGSSGKEVVTAYVLGVECWARVAWTMPLLHTKGWHPTSIFGILGATAAVSKLMKLPADQIAHAFGIAASMASGLTQNFGTDTKSLHAGQAAKNAIVAAKLAAQGFTAAIDAIEGALGFQVGFFRGEAVDSKSMTANLGQPFAAIDPGVNVKKYPCCMLPHRTIDAVLHLTKTHDLRAADIERIDCQMPFLGPKILSYDRPKDGLTAKFSLQHCISAALIDRHLGLAQFTDERVLATDVQQLRSRVNMLLHPKAVAGSTSDDHPDVVTITLKNGKTLEHSVQIARGHADDPLDWAGLELKFRDAVDGVLEAQATASAIDQIGRLEQLADVRSLMKLLGAAPVGRARRAG